MTRLWSWLAARRERRAALAPVIRLHPANRKARP